MTDANAEQGRCAESGTASQSSSKSLLVLSALLSLLFITILVAYLGWTSAGDADVPPFGYLAMSIGVVLSLAVGFGLMALIFYSSRKGYDEPPVLILNGERDDASQKTREIGG